MSDDTLHTRRQRLLGIDAPLFYEQPLHLVRGAGCWLFDADGRRYLDCYNNVPHVGHCHPHVVDALTRQAGMLNVHSRYLHEGVLDYAERLLARLDDSIDMMMFMCTGSEANDQALRIARHATGREGIVCTNLTYHGNTTAVDQVSPLFYGRVSSYPNVRTMPWPDSYRPPRGVAPDQLAEHYAQALERAIDELDAAGAGFAGLIVCSIFANEGLPDVPAGFLDRARQITHDAGGLLIADEVQAGFGRCGTMWGHDVNGVVPDIVTMGKPMGNGYPLAALAARGELVRAFRHDVMYFNTFAASPLGAAVGNAVLDVMDAEDLIANATRMGDRVRAAVGELAAEHEIIGDIRGHGLWIGIELVRDRESKEPADTETRAIVNRMKERGVLMNRIGEFDNVLKLRPPLVFGDSEFDCLMSNLHEVLAAR